MNITSTSFDFIDNSQRNLFPLIYLHLIHILNYIHLYKAWYIKYYFLTSNDILLFDKSKLNKEEIFSVINLILLFLILL